MTGTITNLMESILSRLSIRVPTIRFKLQLSKIEIVVINFIGDKSTTSVLMRIHKKKKIAEMIFKMTLFKMRIMTKRTSTNKVIRRQTLVRAHRR